MDPLLPRSSSEEAELMMARVYMVEGPHGEPLTVCGGCADKDGDDGAWADVQLDANEAWPCAACGEDFHPLEA